MKKKIWMFAIGLFAISLVAAIGYYAFFSTTFTVLPAIVIGECDDTLSDVYNGERYEGKDCTITNDAPTERTITISEDSGTGIDVSYISHLTLSQKVVDFGNEEPWNLTGDTATVEYVVVGDEFSAEIITGEKTGYVLVYYKDNSDRFNSPASAIGIDSIVGNLSYEDDANNDEYDYCETGEYVTCHGAKLWYVPETAVTLGIVDWSQASSFLFETELIQYNSEGELVIYPGQVLTIKPVYEIGDYVTGEYTITTTVA